MDRGKRFLGGEFCIVPGGKGANLAAGAFGSKPVVLFSASRLDPCRHELPPKQFQKQQTQTTKIN